MDANKKGFNFSLPLVGGETKILDGGDLRWIGFRLPPILTIWPPGMWIKEPRFALTDGMLFTGEGLGGIMKKNRYMVV